MSEVSTISLRQDGDSELVCQAAIAIMAGLMSNPNVVVENRLDGWGLCNTSVEGLAEYSWDCARAFAWARLSSKKKE